ncbi:sensor histidine kinase [Undibacterium sp. SXout11W]|uniref:sensor histidine kinase n=1 Tax=Undibacterium sp. SXout11W TaxID=3413050 RepID=UPI003BF3B77C
MMTKIDNRSTEQPLPPEVSIGSDSWLTRARNYPVFSRTWYYYRSLAWLIPLVVIDLLILVITTLLSLPLSKVLPVMLPISIGVSALYLTGPGLAVLVRQLQFVEKKEAIYLTLALVFGGLLSYGVYQLSDYFCEWVSSEQKVHGSFEIAAKFEGHDSPASKEMESGINRFHSVKPKPQVSTASAAASSDEQTAKEANQNINQFLTPVVNGFVDTLIVISLGGGFDLWLFFRQKKRLLEDQRLRELKQAQEARREAELRLSVLVAQVEPHFLFNTLAGVRSAINTEPVRATAIVDHLVDYLRATIPKFRSDGSSSQARLQQQLDAARAYLNLMQARIPRLNFSIESEIADAALPPLMLISLVENAIKHGVEPKIGPAHIAIVARELMLDKQSFLELSVADDGVGFGGTTSGSGIGLENIRERLASMYGDTASLTLKANPEGGVSAIICLPLEK